MCVVMTAAMAAAIVFSDPAATAALTPPVEAPASVAAEPLFADIVSRSQALKLTVDGWIAAEAGTDADLTARPEFDAFKTEDLKCILRGLSEDMPRRLEAVGAATSTPERASALAELSHLFEDNVEVILAPPAPEV